MRADAHQQRALQLEHAMRILGDATADPDIVPSLIENYWGAAFHWIASGCQRKYVSTKRITRNLGAICATSASQ